MIIRKIGGIIARPFRAAMVTVYLATPARMAPMLAPVALTAVGLGLDGCIERYDDFGSSMQASDSMPDAADDAADIVLGHDMGGEIQIAEIDVAEIAAPGICGDDYSKIITGKIIDQSLLKMIRKGLNKGELDDITLGDALGMTTLLADSSLIYYLDGLECFANLSVLGLNYNKISDIKSLAGLKNLIYLNLYGNKVSDLSPISGMPLLNQLSLGHNTFTDISALLDNPGIGEGDTVCLDGNDIPAQQITALKEKGVNVTCAW